VRDARGHIYDAHLAADGYRMVKIAGQKMPHHRVVYLMWYGRQPDGVIDHVNTNKADNQPDNLEDVTHAENMRRSAVDPNRRSGSERKSRPIVGTVGDAVPRDFPSATVAARELGLNVSKISDCCRGRVNSTGGWTFVYAIQPDLDGEEWRSIEGINVSNYGRVNPPTSGKYFPIARINGYCLVKAGGQKFLVHRLVCQAFHGNPPTGYEADHRDRDPGNNRADNLRWLNRADNLANRQMATKLSTRRALTVTSSTGDSCAYESAVLASSALGLARDTIEHLCSSGHEHRTHGVFKYVEVQPLDGEIFKNVSPEHLVMLSRGSSLPHVQMK